MNLEYNFYTPFHLIQSLAISEHIVGTSNFIIEHAREDQANFTHDLGVFNQTLEKAIWPQGTVGGQDRCIYGAGDYSGGRIKYHLCKFNAALEFGVAPDRIFF